MGIRAINFLVVFLKQVLKSVLTVRTEGDRDSRRTRKCSKILRGKGKASRMDFEVTGPQANPVGYRQKIRPSGMWSSEGFPT